MWADYDPLMDSGNRWAVYESAKEQRVNRPDLTAFRVAVIPLDDVEALVERAAKAMWHSLATGEIADNLGPARDALTAAGIPCKQRRARK